MTRAAGLQPRIEEVWRTLVEPSPQVTKPGHRKTARLLAGVLVVLAPLGLISALLQLVGGYDAPLGVVGAAVLALGLAYGLSRTRHWRIAAAIAALVPTVAGLLVLAADSADVGWWAFMALAPLLGSTFLPLPVWSIVSGLNLTAVIAAVLVVSELDSDTAIVALMFNAIVTVVVLVARLHRDGLEAARRAQLLASRRLHDSVLESAFGGIALVEDGVVTEANARFWALLGVRDSATGGAMSVDDLLGTGTMAELGELIESFGGQPVELQLTRLDGSTFGAEVIVRRSPGDDRDVQVLAIRASVSQILNSKALAHAQRMESVGRVAASLAHDTNNELFVISSYAEQARREQLDSGASTLTIERIKESVGRVEVLTRRVLGLGREQIDQRADVELGALIDESRPMWQQVLGRHVDIQVPTATSSRWVVADRVELEQVMLNLVLNSMEAMHGRGVLRVEIDSLDLPLESERYGVRLPAGTYHAITFTDSGDGIAPDVLPRVFDPFFSTKADQRTGLGLYTSRAIVQSIGGAVDAASDGEGATVTILLPERASGQDL